MSDTTVIYYTHNKENESFEKRIQETILENSGSTPIISVSRKPISFGKNICVGETEIDTLGMFRQILIGSQAATSKYIALAESDFLYPPEYFSFKPDYDDMFCMVNPIYVLYSKGRRSCKFYKKRGVECAAIVGRNYLIRCLSQVLSDPSCAERIGNLYRLGKFKFIHLKNPVITFKTGNGMHFLTPMSKYNQKTELPFWGSGIELVRKYCEN